MADEQFELHVPTLAWVVGTLIMPGMDGLQRETLIVQRGSDVIARKAQIAILQQLGDAIMHIVREAEKLEAEKPKEEAKEQ